MKKWRALGVDAGLLVLRVGLGLGLATHGYSKLFSGNMPMFVEKAVAPMGFPMPMVFGYMSGLAEFAGGIFLALGLVTRLTAIPVIFNMGVALVMVHLKNNDTFSGMEKAVCYLVFAVSMLLTGAGNLSLDRLISGKQK